MCTKSSRIYKHVISTLILPENRQNNQRRQVQTLHGECSLPFIHLDQALGNFKLKLLPFILMPPEITLVKYKFEQQFAQSNKLSGDRLIQWGEELTEFAAFKDYINNEGLLEKFQKIQKCIKKEVKN